MYKLKDRAGVAKRAKTHGLHNTKRRKHRLALKVAENNQKLQENRIRKMITDAIRTQRMQVAPQPSAKISMVGADGTETKIEKELFVNPENTVDENTEETEKSPENGM